MKDDVTTARHLTLREWCRRFPGGFRLLAQDIGVSESALRRFADGIPRNIPWDLVRLIAAASAKAPPRMSEAEVVDLFVAQRRDT
jgi:hypothetical protein